jgi:probable rRNA maturation factor
LVRVVQSVFGRYEGAEAAGRVDISLIEEAAMQAVNAEMRGQDRPTDVLTFPAPAHARGARGEIVMNEAQIALQAQRRKVPFVHEAAMLTAHGALHLLGWDDQDDAGRTRMVAAQNEVMVACGFTPDPDWESVPYQEDQPATIPAKSLGSRRTSEDVQGEPD